MNLRQIKARTPYFLKLPYRYTVGIIPYSWRYYRGRIFRETYKFLQQSQWWSKEQLFEYQCRELQKLVNHCYSHVPYYRRIFADYGLKPKDILEPRDLCKLPFLDKEAVSKHLLELTATNISQKYWAYRTTGGTSGKPLSFYVHKRITEEREKAFRAVFLQRVSFRLGEKIVTLRNDVLPKGKKWYYRPSVRRLTLDPFKLTPTNVSEYLEVIARSGIEYLHTYPSAAATLLRFSMEAGDKRKLPIRVIWATSENVYDGQRAFLENGFHARFFSAYGHSERLVYAGECEYSTHYHVFPEYGVTELVDEHRNVIDKPGVSGEIVGTGFNNYVMPMLRYRTGDFAEYAMDQSCKCGRHYPILSKVTGRWLQEMVVRGDGALISITALNMHSDVFDRVRQFQFYQDRKGEVVFNIIRAEGYTAADTSRIRAALMKKLGESMGLEIRFVDDIPRTQRGKHRFLIQKLPIEFGENQS